MSFFFIRWPFLELGTFLSPSVVWYKSNVSSSTLYFPHLCDFCVLPFWEPYQYYLRQCFKFCNIFALIKETSRSVQTCGFGIWRKLVRLLQSFQVEIEIIRKRSWQILNKNKLSLTKNSQPGWSCLGMYIVKSSSMLQTGAPILSKGLSIENDSPSSGHSETKGYNSKK